MSIAWFHCFSGVAGDMALGSLIAAGTSDDLVEIRALLDRLDLTGWSLECEEVLRGGVASVRAIVEVSDDASSRTYADIVELITRAGLPARVEARSLAVFARLGEVEAALHRQPLSQVHFHEVGGHDAIIDIVGTVCALEVLDVDEVRSSPVATGLGMVNTAHGLLPNPAPAVVGLLEGVPTYGRSVPLELTTPTGAALISTLAASFGPMPAMTVRSQGFGAGSRELDELPNATQVVIGEVSAEPREAGQPVVLLEANVDDATGEQLAFANEELLAAGAHDAWLVPIVMKKGRPGVVVSVLCDPVTEVAIRMRLRAVTGSLGVRRTQLDRWPVERRIEVVEIDGVTVRLKVSDVGVKAEYEDVAALARRTGRSLRSVAAQAEGIWRTGHEA